MPGREEQGRAGKSREKQEKEKSREKQEKEKSREEQGRAGLYTTRAIHYPGYIHPGYTTLPYTPWVHLLPATRPCYTDVRRCPSLCDGALGSVLRIVLSRDNSAQSYL